ncbi:hypothetical protein HYC85_012692 [Camellia sinensis]|uniref:Uncharacterized protein n=1 Tax=Camellia sinensis TaxID=4442 RepID=A0A7J7HD83_CAMSI|nr:hypothetical protein HYC85_012692 [Camellia sinensis]
MTNSPLALNIKEHPSPLFFSSCILPLLNQQSNLTTFKNSPFLLFKCLTYLSNIPNLQPRYLPYLSLEWEVEIEGW